jgi:hypothetical protein
MLVIRVQVSVLTPFRKPYGRRLLDGTKYSLLGECIGLLETYDRHVQDHYVS